MTPINQLKSVLEKFNNSKDCAECDDYLVALYGEFENAIELVDRELTGLEDENHDLRNQLNTARRSY